MKKARELLDLFLTFCKLGCFTFGGGWSIVAQMQKTFVDEKKTISEEELLDLASLGRSLPGAMICNVAMLYGYRCYGVLGGFVSIFGLMLPPLIILSAVTMFYTTFRNNTWIAAAMNGVRSAVVPIIISAALGMIKGALKYAPCVFIMVVSLLLYLIFDLNCIYLVIIGAVCGILISEYYERHRGGEPK